MGCSPRGRKESDTTERLHFHLSDLSWASLVAQLVKNPPTIQETRVQFLGWEDSLEKEMATHSSILGLENPRVGEPDGLPSLGSHRVGHD